MAVPVAEETISKEDSSGGILTVETLKGLTAVVELVSATGKRTTKIFQQTILYLLEPEKFVGSSFSFTLQSEINWRLLFFLT